MEYYSTLKIKELPSREMKEPNLKPYIILSQRYDILEKAKLWKQ
jgi:hypothetical protein